MTKEEAIKELTQLLHEDFLSEYSEAIRTAIKALEESCDDAISREAVMHILDEVGGDFDSPREAVVPIDYIADMVAELPSVTPQQKIGRWITWKEAGNYIPSETRFECSVCHDAAQTLCNGLDLLSTYCPNCGAKMQEAEE